MTLICSWWPSHDASYCIMKDGKVLIHAEIERYNRMKETMSNTLEYVFEDHNDIIESIDYWVTVSQPSISRHRFGCYGNPPTEKHCPKGVSDDAFRECINKVELLSEKKGRKVIFVPHHTSHAANTFFSSTYDDAIIFTIDGGGHEPSNDDPQRCGSFFVYEGKNNKITPIEEAKKDQHKLNIGMCWDLCVKNVFGLSTGYPRGSQAGTVMAMASFANSEKAKEYASMLIPLLVNFEKHKETSRNNILKLKQISNQSEQDSFDVAGGLQMATEQILFETMETYLAKSNSRNLCLSGGVALNTVAVGKMYDRFSKYIDNIYVTPTPYDGGLTIGACQYVWHHMLDNPRIKEILSPYLGQTFSKDRVLSDIEKVSNKISYKICDDEEVIHHLANEKVIAIFGGGSESGRRALGCRSILADPRNHNIKNVINQKVKHRAWFRPFAPSILREHVAEWFEKDISSPYMDKIIQFKPGSESRVPGVVHVDGSGRLQTVTHDLNPWYYNFIKKWYEYSGVPMVLNTSFNDREPICETPEHAINCFLNTNIDYLYFYDYNVIVEKKAI